MISDDDRREPFLSPAGIELVKLLLEKTGISLQPLEESAQMSDSGPIPLTFGQERLLFLDQLFPRSSSYNIPVALLLSGSLNLHALSSSLDLILLRHSALRSAFSSSPSSSSSSSSCSISSLSHLPFSFFDLSSLSVSLDSALAVASHLAGRPFDLSRPPLLRVALLKINPHLHLLLLTVHHIVCDGWSVSLILDDLSSLYSCLCQGYPSSLHPLPVTFSEFASHQRASLSSPALQNLARFWSSALVPLPPRLDLPADRPRPARPSFLASRLWLTLPDQLSARVLALSRRHQVTPFMLLLAAFQLLLWRYSGSSHFLLGTVAANRHHQKLDRVVGFFANTLALNCDLTGDPTVAELLARVCKVTLGAFEHQDYPFEKVVEQLQPQRASSRQPLFDVMFVMQNATIGEVGMCGLEVKEVEVESLGAKCDLLMEVRQATGGQMKVMVEYSREIYEQHRARRMLANYEQVLSEVVAHPLSRISDLPAFQD